MTAQLPTPGGDVGTWGTILNNFLRVSLNSDGTIEPSAIVMAGAVTSINSITPSNGNVNLTATQIGALATANNLSDVASTTTALGNIGGLAKAGGTMTGWLAPKVVTLTDAATISVNAALGNDFRVQLGGNHAIGVPSGPTDGQRITIHIQQPASGGPFTPTFTGGAGGFNFGTAATPNWSTIASEVDITGWLYRADINLWCYMGSGTGY